jgi:hypothetical protein
VRCPPKRVNSRLSPSGQLFPCGSAINLCLDVCRGADGRKCLTASGCVARQTLALRLGLWTGLRARGRRHHATYPADDATRKRARRVRRSLARLHEREQGNAPGRAPRYTSVALMKNGRLHDGDTLAEVGPRAKGGSSPRSHRARQCQRSRSCDRRPHPGSGGWRNDRRWRANGGSRSNASARKVIATASTRSRAADVAPASARFARSTVLACGESMRRAPVLRHQRRRCSRQGWALGRVAAGYDAPTSGNAAQ